MKEKAKLNRDQLNDLLAMIISEDLSTAIFGLELLDTFDLSKFRLAHLDNFGKGLSNYIETYYSYKLSKIKKEALDKIYYLLQDFDILFRDRVDKVIKNTKGKRKLKHLYDEAISYKKLIDEADATRKIFEGKSIWRKKKEINKNKDD